MPKAKRASRAKKRASRSLDSVSAKEDRPLANAPRRGGWAGTISTHVVQVSDLLSEDPATKPDGGLYGLRFLGEGDSWFSVNAVPWSANVLEQLRFSQPSIVVTLAEPGDTVRRMSEISRNPRLQMYLANRNFASRWDAMFFSGGGNDVIDAAGSIIVSGSGDDPTHYVDQGVLERTLDEIRKAYRQITAIRDSSSSPNQGCPIIVHTYDYATPRNSPAKFLGLPALGPWLYRALTLAGVRDPEIQRRVADHIFDALADTLVALAAELPNVTVVNTRGLLERASSNALGNDKDWLNEIHPNTGGYSKIAARLVRDL